MLFVLVFFAFPLGFAFYISLTNWPLIGPYEFVGKSNYVALIHDPVFVHSLLFTAEYTAIVVPAVLVVGYGLASFLRTNRPGSTIFRTLLFIPFVVGLATESYMLLLELQPDAGVIGFLLGKIGIAGAGTEWLVRPGLALLAVCVLIIWSQSGFIMVILMAGMQAIPPELYEVASIDGSTWWEKERFITLPLLRRTLALGLIIDVIGSLLAFNQFYILTRGGPGTSTMTIVMWIYQVAFALFHLGYATAMSIVLLVIIASISVVQFYLLRSED
jgi:multiple sugar transport system permease protein